MGQGIAQWFCQQGVSVFLVDREEQLAKAATFKILKSWDDLALKGKFSLNEVLAFKKNLTFGVKEDISSCQLVIEAIFEDLKLKQELFQYLDQKLDPTCLLATNTSSFLLKDLQLYLSDERKKNFLGLHFFNPATLMKLVEVIKGPWTLDQTILNLKEWFNSKGKVAVICQDSPGFIVNRLARHFYGESLRIAEEMGAQEKDFSYIDETLSACGGFKMGPFVLMDLIGIDINLDVTNSIWKAFNHHQRFAPHPLQIEKVKNKMFGKKTKHGFYHYE